jgi:HD-GYP domain-containing protein (c-di-GMP phosphodiesterase class II)
MTRLPPPPVPPGHPEPATGLPDGADGLLRDLAAHDPSLAGHSQRVRRYAYLLAAALGLNRQETRRLAWAAQLHEVGKVVVPRSILMKPGPLTPAEHRRVREHPAAGERLAAACVGEPEVLAAIRSHHERFDGHGYPDGLAGRQIPHLARVLAVADGFDAMTSPRPYRAALSRPEALDELRRAAGTQYDGPVVEAFLALAGRAEKNPPTRVGCVLWFC